MQYDGDVRGFHREGRENQNDGFVTFSAPTPYLVQTFTPSSPELEAREARLLV